MMGKQAAPDQLFYDFCINDHVPGDHPLRWIDPFLDVSEIRTTLRPYYNHVEGLAPTAERTVNPTDTGRRA